MKKNWNRFAVWLLVFGCHPVAGQNRAIDVQHYRFALALNDSNNIIRGTAGIDFLVKSAAPSVVFNLTGLIDSSGRGMRVTGVSEGHTVLQFSQAPDQISIYFNHPLQPNTEENISITYEGIPADGLVIDTNKFGRRTFFADNWPNRAHNWIPCNDHPGDKATVEFLVTAPDHYQVVANGILLEESNLPDHLKLTHWKEERVLPTKVMVIGAADFAVRLDSVIDCIPVSSWVFPDNRDSGFAQYSVSKKILPFFISYIGPYPFEKLANVQSKTIFGGMENAGNIFYYENSVAQNPLELKQNRSIEELFAHETAHQWFGDDASEVDWPHLWLSEGFATYMTHLYMERRYGKDTLQKGMIHDRAMVIAFDKKVKTPVVDTSSARDLMKLLNPNSYQKGSWVLHMLRRKLGDVNFQKSIQVYYATFKGKNAATDDLMRIMEKVSGQNLHSFFKQWLYTPGIPIVRGRWSYNIHNKTLELVLQQQTDVIFQFSLQLAIKFDSRVIFKTIDVKKKNTSITLPFPHQPDSLILDPEVNLLFDGKLVQSNL